MGIGKKLSDKINQKGLTKKQVAEAAQVPATTLYSIIQRDNTKVEIDAFLRICDVLGCAPEDFANDIPKNITQNSDILTSDEKKLLDTYRNFNDEGKEKLLDTASDMAQLDRYKKCAKSDVVEKQA
ncbi:MAG: helix-turn-helix transcriptional regulator [Eubacterium sp.]|nr:helix-turn-helix transcriptional regulator [Eubacterium sp.]